MFRKSLKQRAAFYGLLFATPAIILLVMFKIAPIGMAVFASFTDWSTTKGFIRFVGINNYKLLLSDPFFKVALLNSLFFALFLTFLQILIALALAFLLYRTSAVNVMYRLAIFHPYAISLSIASLIWWIIYAEWGLLNGIIAKMGLSRQNWLSTPGLAFWALILMLTWKGIGYWMMVLIAGINNIPHDIREAATIDGATFMKRLIHVELPLLKRPLAFVFVADTTINFLLFAPPYIMTGGGPQNATLVLPLYAYRLAFVYTDMGYANSVSTVLLAIVAFVVATELILFRSGVQY